jgi:hypothetical protein
MELRVSNQYLHTYDSTFLLQRVFNYLLTFKLHRKSPLSATASLIDVAGGVVENAKHWDQTIRMPVSAADVGP